MQPTEQQILEYQLFHSRPLPGVTPRRALLGTSNVQNFHEPALALGRSMALKAGDPLIPRCVIDDKTTPWNLSLHLPTGEKVGYLDEPLGPFINVYLAQGCHFEIKVVDATRSLVPASDLYVAVWLIVWPDPEHGDARHIFPDSETPEELIARNQAREAAEAEAALEREAPDIPLDSAALGIVGPTPRFAFRSSDYNTTAARPHIVKFDSRTQAHVPPGCGIAFHIAGLPYDMVRRWREYVDLLVIGWQLSWMEKTAVWDDNCTGRSRVEIMMVKQLPQPGECGPYYGPTNECYIYHCTPRLRGFELRVESRAAGGLYYYPIPVPSLRLLIEAPPEIQQIGNEWGFKNFPDQQRLQLHFTTENAADLDRWQRWGDSWESYDFFFMPTSIGAASCIRHIPSGEVWQVEDLSDA